MSTLTVFVSCIIAIAIMVTVYEFKLSKISKENKKLRSHNNKLAMAVCNLSDAGDDLLISYKALLEVAEERLDRKELEESFQAKREILESQYFEEKGETYGEEDSNRR